MRRPFVVSLAFTILGVSLLSAQEGGPTQSGPKVKSFLKAPFDCYNLNNPALKDPDRNERQERNHCLVCQFNLRPSVLIFAREPEKGKDGPLDALLTGLEKVAADFKEQELQVGVVFLSPDAQSSATQPEVKDSKKLVEEAARRDDLLKRLRKKAEGFKHVIVACYPEPGPKGYDLNAKAEETVIVYDRLKVKANYAYGPGQLRDENVEMIVQFVRQMMDPDAVEKK